MRLSVWKARDQFQEPSMVKTRGREERLTILEYASSVSSSLSLVDDGLQALPELMTTTSSWISGQPSTLAGVPRKFQNGSSSSGFDPSAPGAQSSVR